MTLVAIEMLKKLIFFFIFKKTKAILKSNFTFYCVKEEEILEKFLIFYLINIKNLIIQT